MYRIYQWSGHQWVVWSATFASPEEAQPELDRLNNDGSGFEYRLKKID